MSPGDGEFELVRPFVLTRGRTEPTTGLDMNTTVLATGRVNPLELQHDHAQTLRLCQQPRSVAEVAAHLHYPVLVAKVLLADLLDHEALTMRTTPSSNVPSPRILERALDGLRNL